MTEQSDHFIDNGRKCIPFIRVMLEKDDARLVLNLSTLHTVLAHDTSESQK